MNRAPLEVPGTGPASAVARPERTCVGCRRRAASCELVRLAVVDGTVRVDARRRLPGRGAYLHPARDCVERAIGRRAIPRALRAPAAAIPEGLADAVVAAAG